MLSTNKHKLDAKNPPDATTLEKDEEEHIRQQVDKQLRDELDAYVRSMEANLVEQYHVSSPERAEITLRGRSKETQTFQNPRRTKDASITQSILSNETQSNENKDTRIEQSAEEAGDARQNLQSLPESKPRRDKRRRKRGRKNAKV